MPQSGAATSSDARRRDDDPRPAARTAPRRVSGPASGPDAGSGVPERRMVTIRGRGSERYVPIRSSRDRRPERRYERPGFQPDRVAMWAILLGVVLIVAAASTAHAATLSAVALHAVAR